MQTSDEKLKYRQLIRTSERANETDHEKNIKADSKHKAYERANDK